MKKEKIKAVGILLFLMGTLANMGYIFSSQPLEHDFYFFLLLSLTGIAIWIYGLRK